MNAGQFTAALMTMEHGLLAMSELWPWPGRG